MCERERNCVIVGGEMYGKRVGKREKVIRRQEKVTNIYILYKIVYRKPKVTKLEDLYLVIVSRGNCLVLCLQVR